MASKNGEEWRKETLGELTEQIMRNSQVICDKILSSNETEQSLMKFLCESKESQQLATRLHLFLLMSQVSFIFNLPHQFISSSLNFRKEECSFVNLLPTCYGILIWIITLLRDCSLAMFWSRSLRCRAQLVGTKTTFAFVLRRDLQRFDRKTVSLPPLFTSKE